MKQIKEKKEREDNIRIIEKLEEILELRKFDADKIRILVLTLKNKDHNKIKVVINLNNFYLLGFINNQNQYFYFDDELLKRIEKINQNKITELKDINADLEEFNKLTKEKKKNNTEKERCKLYYEV